MIKNNNKGFTLIELLVVIAIIGILASVVLASLSTARSRGKDAAIKAGVSSAITQAEIEVNGGAYTAVCPGAVLTDISPETALGNITANVNGNGGALSCSATGTNIAVYSKLASSATTYQCVDNNGTAKTSTSTAAAGKCL